MLNNQVDIMKQKKYGSWQSVNSVPIVFIFTENVDSHPLSCECIGAKYSIYIHGSLCSLRINRTIHSRTEARKSTIGANPRTRVKKKRSSINRSRNISIKRVKSYPGFLRRWEENHDRR